jgi:pimeloyl-ACP methyl ester carboxylesterase
VPAAVASDGTWLHVEETGSGTPILFVHEFAGDARSWEPQMRSFGLRYRCIAYNARGYPPSAVPASEDAYSQAHAVGDAVAVLDALGVRQAHVVGLSMGGFCALHLALDHPERCRSIVVAGCGYGARPDQRAGFAAEAEATARAFRADPVAAARRYAEGPTRVQLRDRNPRAYAELVAQLEEHSGLGSALTMLGVQRRRPSLYDLAPRLAEVTVPTLLITGDEDDGCIEPSLMLKRTMGAAGLVVLPRTGHTCNLEDPAAFDAVVQDFLTTVDAGRWSERNPASLARGLIGMDEGEAAGESGAAVRP